MLGRKMACRDRYIPAVCRRLKKTSRTIFLKYLVSVSHVNVGLDGWRMPRSALNVSFDTTPRGEIIHATPGSELTPRSPWSYFRFQTKTKDDVRKINRKSRERARHTPHSARSKTSSPERRRRQNARGSNSRAKSSSPPPFSRPPFDPTVDRHLWTMWRIAITSQIVTDIFSRSKDNAPSRSGGRLKRPPPNLAKSIFISNQSRQAAYSMMNSGVRPDNAILTTDFIYYGIPRVILNKRTH